MPPRKKMIEQDGSPTQTRERLPSPNESQLNLVAQNNHPNRKARSNSNRNNSQVKQTRVTPDNPRQDQDAEPQVADDGNPRPRRKRSKKGPRRKAHQAQDAQPPVPPPVPATEEIEEESAALAKLTIRFGNDMPTQQRKASNKVRTTKYTLLTWAPLSLLFQFKRAANIYFLIISVLTTMSFSPKKPASMIGTFAMVLFATMLKEAYEDYQRFKSDREMNKRPAQVLDRETGVMKNCLWEDIKVGDIVKCEKDMEVPADLLCVCAQKDIVFVSTMNLDGETNLKDRELAITSVKEKHLKNFTGQVVCDEPNASLDVWDGNLSSTQLGRIRSCNIKNLLLRGCTLKNSHFCYGICLYVGAQTKIFMNSKKPPRKISNLMKLMNKMLYTVFAFQLIIILIFAGASLLWMQKNMAVHSYLSIEGELGVLRFIEQFFTYWVAYSHMIPISLYVIIEMLKLLQSNLIDSDVKMFFTEDMSYALCRNSDLIEELGQVEFVFSDKTGTLTQNKMEFKKCQMNSTVFGHPSQEDLEQGIPENEGMRNSSVDVIKNSMSWMYKEIQAKTDKKVRQQLQSTSRPKNLNNGDKLYQFFRLLAVCHTVVVDKDPKTNEIQYQASSPDELALIQGAKQAGLILMDKSASKMVVDNEITGVPETYDILAEFPFDSTRKRMSLIVRYNGQYILMSKGADSIILPRIMFKSEADQVERVQIMKDLLSFAKEGLRTLVVGQKFLTESQYHAFENEYQKLKTSTFADKEKKLNALYNRYEQDLVYCGSTAIEDKLQYGVPETIAKLIEANIKVWVLTGDKQETAIEIGKSCKLVQEDMTLIILSSATEEEFRDKLLDCIRDWNVNLGKKTTDLDQLRADQAGKPRISIVIDGPTLTYALQDEHASNAFFQVGLLASSVICCRVSPKQKADVVGLAKKNGKWITVSIGDGANDVPMIMEAHIGVGVRGKEGTQAVRSADYAVSQFMYLHRLLLVHGRWGYRRVSWLVCYYFYKNIVLVFTEIFFATENGYSGQIFFAEWLPTMYNAVWTSWQCLFAYTIEQDVNDQYIYKYPQLYAAGQKGVYFNFKIFWRWIFFSIWHGACCYFGTIYGLAGPIDSSGLTYQHWFSSSIAFTLIIHIIVFKLFLETVFWNWLSVATGAVCLLLYYGCVIILNVDFVASQIQAELNGEYFNIITSGKAWVCLIVLPAVALLPDVTYMLCQKIFFPTPTDAVLLKQQRDPSYVYDGFDEVYVPPLPNQDPPAMTAKPKAMPVVQDEDMDVDDQGASGGSEGNDFEDDVEESEEYASEDEASTPQASRQRNPPPPPYENGPSTSSFRNRKKKMSH